MNELLRQLGEIHQRNAQAVYLQKTQAMLMALKAGLIGLDDLAVTPDSWNLIEFVVEEPAPCQSAETSPTPS